MPSIQDILNVLPGYQSEQQRFNYLTQASRADQARAMTLQALNAATMLGPGKMPMAAPEMAPEVAPEAVPLPSAPRSNTGYSLSQNIAPPAPDNAPTTAGTPFHYKIFKDGEELGYAHGTVKGGTATVNNIYTDEDSLGLQGLKSLRNQVRQDFPKVTTFEGYRISGARWGQAADPNNRDSFTSIKIPAMLAAILGYGAANKNGGQQ
jgi:hypothetical protein